MAKESGSSSSSESAPALRTLGEIERLISSLEKSHLPGAGLYIDQFRALCSKLGMDIAQNPVVLEQEYSIVDSPQTEVERRAEIARLQQLVSILSPLAPL